MMTKYYNQVKWRLGRISWASCITHSCETSKHNKVFSTIIVLEFYANSRQAEHLEQLIKQM